jgi:hypothetical protein
MYVTNWDRTSLRPFFFNFIKFFASVLVLLNINLQNITRFLGNHPSSIGEQIYTRIQRKVARAIILHMESWPLPYIPYVISVMSVVCDSVYI